MKSSTGRQAAFTVVLAGVLAMMGSACTEKRSGDAPAGSASAVANLPGETARASASGATSGSAAPSGAANTTASAANTNAGSATGAADASAPEFITAQHILVAYKGAKTTPPTITRSKADAKKRAEEAAEKAHVTGADFTALVKEYSDDPNAKDRLGNLGKFSRDRMVKPFSDAAFALAVGEVSGVVETPFGFHVIKRNQ